MIFIVVLIISSAIMPLSERYHTFYEVEQQLLDWENQFSNNDNPWPAQYPNSGIIYQLSQIGVSTHDNLPIYAVKLSYDANEDNDEARVLILGQCHAEEIYGVEIAMEMIDWLLHPNAFYPVNYLDRKMALENTELWIVPTHNPEGLLTVHGDTLNGEWIQDEWYRKNKTDINANGIFDYVYGPGNDSDGVDLNRNYDFNWIFGDDKYELDYGCSGNPSYISNYDYYRGEEPFSELEIQAIRDFAIEKKFLLSIAYHSSRSGCVSEKVIYPWKWTETKESPDFEVIDKLGRDIASFIPTQDGITTYLPSGSVSRRGNAHDWFYSQTGCIQYLIEAGTSNIQTNDEQIIEDTIDRNLIGAFHLINRASGNNFGEIGADKYLINGLVMDSNSSETLDAEVTILEMDGPMLKPRMTDQFGRFRRLLYPGSFTLQVKSKGYQTYVESDIVPSASSFLEKDIFLEPLNTYVVDFNFNYPDYYNLEDPLILTVESEWDIEEYEIFSNTFTLNLYEGSYNVSIRGSSSNHIVPVIDNFVVDSNFEQNYNLGWAKLLYSGISPNDWNVHSGDWYFDNELYSQSSSYYSSDSFGSLTLNESFAATDIVAFFDVKYEYEWDNDYLQFSVFSNEGNISNVKTLTGHNYKSFNSVILGHFGENELNDLSINISTYTDESLYYRGCIIKDLKIVSDSGNQVCNLGDSNFDGLISINDIMKVLNIILQIESADGYYKCVSDLNQDDGINILDISILINLILGD
tara:strand:- start:397 stop:2643 length:2247 start_codon:yes stop_codon:yes gene_type:complete